LHAHVQSFLKRYLWCVCLLNFLDLDLPKSMFKFVNADMTLKKRERSERAIFLELFDFVCHVCCVSWWKLQTVNRFLYSYITPIFWVRILYYEKPPIFPIFSYILNIIPIFLSELVAALQTLFFLVFLLALEIKLTLTVST